MNKKFLRRIIIGILLVISVYLILVVIQVFRWNTQHWFFKYAWNKFSHKTSLNLKNKHVIFTWVDHYEPGKGSRGTQFNKKWLEKFKKISNKHKDSYGNRFKYSWFYPYDHKNDSVVLALNRMVFNGYGEIEFHWHHHPMNSDEFKVALDSALNWFQSYGVGLTLEDGKFQTHFGFIHGNWVLDNSGPQCGVNNEISILHDAGCYADFTFSTIETSAQPSMINSIYYAIDDSGPKSYDKGIPVTVNSIQNHLMIFQGPLGFNFSRLSFEYGAVEAFAPGNKDRIKNWIKTNIHVKGKPEWIFVKVFSHGAQSYKKILNKNMDQVLTDLEEFTKKNQIKLHYVTAREAYNIVKAAEAGKTGDPEQFRNFLIPAYVNMQIPVNYAMTKQEMLRLLEKK